jgi:hypothetical protein
MLKKCWSYIFDNQIGDWNGVSVYSNKRYENDETVKNYYNGVFTGIRWQCVEYTRSRSASTVSSLSAFCLATRYASANASRSCS